MTETKISTAPQLGRPGRKALRKSFVWMRESTARTTRRERPEADAAYLEVLEAIHRPSR